MDKKQIFINDESTKYYITDEGLLYNEKTKKYIKGSVNGGYLYYNLRHEGVRYIKSSHKLVAEYFIPNPYNLSVVNHKDGNKLNNCKDNLEWVTYADNNLHAYSTGLKKRSNGLQEREKYIEDLPGEKWKNTSKQILRYLIQDALKILKQTMF